MHVERNLFTSEGLQLMKELSGNAAAPAGAAAAARWKPGQQVQAKFSADGMMYKATVESFNGSGGYLVFFKGYGNKCVC